jgi:hypothetical protein
MIRTLTHSFHSTSLFRAVLCLLLAVLFLYNPFFGIHSASSALRVQHLPSYRATVASSELNCSSVTQVKLQIPILAAVIFQAFSTPAAIDTPTHRFQDDAKLLSSPSGFSSSLWFRPPPAV